MCRSAPEGSWAPPLCCSTCDPTAASMAPRKAGFKQAQTKSDNTKKSDTIPGDHSGMFLYAHHIAS